MQIITFILLIISTSIELKPSMEFKPERISKCSSITLNAPIEKVFPLFGPVMEKEWAEGWDPEIIYSESDLVEEHMIFRTKAHHSSEDRYTWVITQFNPQQHQLEYTVSTSNRIWFIRVQCKPQGVKTLADVCYTYMGLTELGNELNREALKKMYALDLRDWEEAINYYLKNGRQKTNH
jgi:hypothetical protein